uniref:ARAD1A01782p n=1 Tax=Blastobotrys adeninivorans TaxID=409370 RepID=A0A060T2H9_BLAAD
MSLSELTEAELDVVTEVFGQFMEAEDEEGAMHMSVDNLEDAMKALGITSFSKQEYEAIRRTLDLGNGKIEFEPFAEVMVLKMRQDKGGQMNTEDQDKQLLQDYLLFTEGQDRPIRVDDLRRIAADIKDQSTIDELQQMMMGLKEIDFATFKDIVSQANSL